MKRLLLLTTAALIALAAPGVANAAVQNLAISGSVGGHDYTGELSLDVSGGQAISGTGTLSILGLNNAPLVLITASTPGDEGAPEVGFRGNDGTDYFDLDQAYPISTNGLLFDVDTTTARKGTSRSSPSGRKGRATTPPSPATSAGPSITTCAATRWPRRLARFLSPQLGRWACLASEASASWAGGRAAPIGWP